MSSNAKKKFENFDDFYVFYLNEHQNPVCRGLHFVGSFLVIVTIIFSLLIRDAKILILCPVIGYGFAWFGHLLFEKNKPATFKYPIYSFIGDWAMFFEILLGKRKIKEETTNH